MFPGTARLCPSSVQAFSIAVNAGPSPALLNNLSFGGNPRGGAISLGVASLTQSIISTGMTSSQPILQTLVASERNRLFRRRRRANRRDCLAARKQ